MPRTDGAASTARGRLTFRPRLLTTAFAVPALAVLLGLGIWQLQRMVWKETLIQTVVDRTNAPAVPLPSGKVLGQSDVAALEFRRVRVTGDLQHGSSMELLNRTLDGRVGVHVITPLVRLDGDVVLIDRGWAPPEVSSGGGAPDVERAEIEGFVRAFRVPGRFVPENEPGRDLWYSMDAAEMAAAAGVEEVVPVYVAVVPVEAAGGFPRAVAPGVNLRNSHRQYAITWFGLAAGLLAVFAVFHTRRTDV